MNDRIFVAPEAERLAQQLLADGYCIIPDALPSGLIEELDQDLAGPFEQTPFCQGGFYGATTKRLGRVLVRTTRAATLVQHPLILDIVDRILSPWCDTIQLNVAQAIEIHPGAPAQLPHRDHDMWIAPVGGEAEYLVNIIWPLTEFTADNGATVLWRGSHGPRALDPNPAGDPLPAVMSPGSALVFLGSTLHGAGANVTGQVRRGLVIGYSLGWLKPYENPWLSYPPEIARTFSPELAALVGYRQHRPNLGNFEGRCPSVLLDTPPEGPLGAVDALRPDQEALVATFVEDQARAS